MDGYSDFPESQILNGNVCDRSHEDISYDNSVPNFVKAIKSLTVEIYEDISPNFTFGENQFPSSSEISIPNNLTYIPNEIFNLKHLKVLQVRRNLINSLPKNIGKLENLVFLDLSHNQLEQLPHTLSLVAQLRYLNISHNNFTAVPSVFYEGLQLLRILDLSFNKINQFDIPPLCIHSIINLNLCHNELKKIPNWIFHGNCNIEIIDISYNSLTAFDNYFLCSNMFLKFVTNVHTLNLQNCKLTSENLEFISNIRSLTTLRLNNHDVIKNSSRNYFKNLSSTVFENCLSLKNLILSDVGIPCLPSNFGNQIKFIQYLDLEKNYLSWLPDSFCEMHCLKICRLSSNSIFCLPNNIGNLINLKEIYLNDNKFSEIPSSFKDLINLEYVDLYYNCLEYFDPDIINNKSLKGIDLECNYLNYIQLFEDETKHEQFISKYMILKEHFRKQILHNRIDLQNKKYNDVAEEIDDDYSASESDSDDTSVRNDIKLRRTSPDIENWDNESTGALCELNNEDEFDPNVSFESKYNINKIRTNTFKNNFCPADTHFPSILIHFMRNSFTMCEDTTIEGQYDSD